MDKPTREEVLQNYADRIHEGIYGLFGFHRALSNFHIEQFDWAGTSWPSSENAYQAAKFGHAVWPEFAQMTPGQAKRAGASRAMIYEGEHWKQARFGLMRAILKEKFKTCITAREVLMSTGDLHLEEANWWGDTNWGTVNGIGANNLGKLLMEIREDIRGK